MTNTTLSPQTQNYSFKNIIQNYKEITKKYFKTRRNNKNYKENGRNNINFNNKIISITFK